MWTKEGLKGEDRDRLNQLLSNKGRAQQSEETRILVPAWEPDECS